MPRHYRALSTLLLFWLTGPVLFAQNGGQLSGNLQLNANFFQRDSLIGAANTPQYDHQLYGGEGWLNLYYSNWGFDLGLRYDFFNNSNLLNPTGSYSAEGIGMFFIRKDVGNFSLQGGYIYDQIGSGIIFRAFEERPLLIDNALIGVQVAYDFSPDWTLKGFTGQQKQQFDNYASVVRGLNLEGFIQPDSTKSLTLAPGFGAVGRTLDDASMNNLVATLNTYPEEDLFEPQYNSYAFSLYNTLAVGPFSWYIEGAYKTQDNISDPLGVIIRNGNPVVGDKFISETGSVIYSSISFAKSGFGITLEGKRTENFSFRTRPQAQLNRGMINFLPPLTRLNTYRLLSRYNAATQELGEQAFQADIVYSPNRSWSFNVNATTIDDLEGVKLYREVFTEVQYRYKRLWKLVGGIQMQNYNQERYEFKPDAPIVETFTPYLDFLYKFDRKKSIRFEAQYMVTGRDERTDFKHDYGDWAFGLVEVSIAPHWTFSVSDMYNVTPGKNSPIGESGERESKHYPRLDVTYVNKGNRFGLSYVKQVEGVVCTGGICRLEPAFSGVKFTLNSSF